MSGLPSAAVTRAALIEVRTRSGISVERLRGTPLTELHVVTAALLEQQRDPADLPHITFEVLQCEAENGAYSNLHRSILIRTINFAGDSSDLTKRREELQDEHNLWGKEYELVEGKAYDRYAGALVAARYSQCHQDETVTRLRDSYEHTRKTFDDLAIQQLQQALTSFGFSRTPKEAREKAVESIKALPLAIRRLYEQGLFDDTRPERALDLILNNVIERVYAPWLVIRRSLNRFTSGAYFSLNTMRLWLNAQYADELDRIDGLAYHERDIEDQLRPQDQLLFWNSRDGKYPGWRGSERNDFVRTIDRDILDNSLFALSEAILWIEASENWEWVLPEPLGDKARISR